MVAREREIQNCGNKKSPKKGGPQESSSSRSRYGGTRQRARTISIQNKINITIVMRHNRLQLFVCISSEL
jgi:hypothetical protein